MITLKQIEALKWVAQLGTFERAATKLNTTQSAISKRIKELESAAGVPVFDRSQRSARLTEKGEHLVALAQQMLALQERMLDLKDAQEIPARRLRLGVTELTALTWLPQLVSALRESYPMVMIEPEVDMSRDLYDRLQEDKLDIVVIPEAFSDPQITSLRLAEIQNVWMASPNLIRNRRVISLEELANYTILIQGSRSGSGLYVSKWLKSEGIILPRMLSCDSMIALLGLAVAGIGVSYLPKQCFRPLVSDGTLKIIRTKPALPLVPYAAMYRNDRPIAFTRLVAQLAQVSCDFSRQFQR
jgi:DNA-binding transcriptional LysR family regulator